MPLPRSLEKLQERLLRVRNNPGAKKVSLSSKEIEGLCVEAERSFLDQPTLLRIQAPIKVCGDIHGQFFDLLRLFDIGGQPPGTRYLFLGDYVDRGRNSLETICLLLCLKVSYPKSFFLLRGNHEDGAINRIYGFHTEVRRRFRGKGQAVFDRLNLCFNHMPLAAVIRSDDGDTFCVHGGIGPGLRRLSQIRHIQRPLAVPEGFCWISGLLWSDPDSSVEKWEKMDKDHIKPNHRGCGHLFGEKVLCKFLERNGLKMIVRGHEEVPKGSLWGLHKKVVTLFSAPNYGGYGNVAAIMTIRKSGTTGFQRFR